MPRTGLRIFTLLIAATGSAVFANAVRPRSLPWVIDPARSVNPGENKQLAVQASVTIDEVRLHLANASATFVDARKPEEFAEGHLAGAVNIPSTQKEKYLDQVFALPQHETIIIYCGGGNCEASHEVFEFLVGNGFKVENLRLFEPGWELLSTLTDIPVSYGIE